VEAEPLIDTAIELARRLGFDRSVGDFLMDRRQLRTVMSDHDGAMRAALEAAAMFTKGA
jgi:hypothetical protein